MKFLSATLLIALLTITNGVGIDYTATTSFTSCPTTTYNSPIQFENVLCSPYGSFSINLGKAAGAPVTNTPTPFNNYYLDYTGSTVEFNGITWNSVAVVAHARAEHVLPGGNQADLELQIIFKDASNNIAITSFLVFSTESGNAQVDQGRKAVLTKFNPITSLSSSNWDIDFKLISDHITEKVKNDIWLNFFQYYGTPNFNLNTFSSNCSVLWLVYGSEIYADPAVFTEFQNLLGTGNIDVTLLTGNTQTPKQNSLQAIHNGGTKSATKLCYTGYFTITLYANYGLWFGVVLTLLFFIFTLSIDNKPIDKIDYQETAWTHHPIISIKRVGNDIFTRKSRCTLVYLTIINFFVWNSFWFRLAYQDNKVEGWMTVAYALQTIPIGWVVTYFVGFWLRRYYLKKAELVRSTEENPDDKESQYNIFMFYFFNFIAFWICNSFCVWNMDNVGSTVDTKTSNLWVASLFIGLALEWIIFDPFVCFIASKSPRVFNWIKWKGYVYDHVCHETYLASIKRS